MVAQAGRVPETVEQPETGVGAVAHRHRDHAVERDDRGRFQDGKHVVEGDDLDPVGACDVVRLVVQRRDRRLNPVRPGGPAGQRRHRQPAAILDQIGVPAAAVLLLQRYQRTVGVDPGRAAGVDEQHQGQQSRRRPFGRQQPMQDPAQPDGFVAQVRP